MFFDCGVIAGLHENCTTILDCMWIDNIELWRGRARMRRTLCLLLEEPSIWVVDGIADGLHVGGNFRCVPGIGPRSENGRAEDWPLVLYTPARLFFYCDWISRLHWDCNRIEDCSRIVRIVGKAFERDLDGCCMPGIDACNLRLYKDCNVCANNLG